MTQVELSAQAANFQRAISSATTCSSATVESLKAILLPDPPISSQLRKPLAKPMRIPSNRTKQRSADKPSRQNIIAICEDMEQKQGAVDLEERLALATNIFNQVLKCLSEATRFSACRASNRPKGASLGRCSSDLSSPKSSSPRSQTPLQPISVNQNITPRQTASQTCSSSEIYRDNDGLKAQARCAQIALASLRAIQDEGKRKVDLTALQVETGMSALINKFIALGFYDLAVREIRILRKRLYAALDVGRAPTKSAAKASKLGPRNSGSSVVKESLIGLLSFRHATCKGLVLSLVVTTQLQVLKILAQAGLDEPESLLEQLDFNTADSLVSLILRQANSNAETMHKAARELEIVAQLVLRICHKLTSTERHSNAYLEGYYAETILKLQTAALAVRAKWWSLSKHEMNVAKDVLIPLSRLLITFKKHTQLPNEKQYRAAQHAFMAIHRLIQPNDDYQDRTLSSIYHILADLAQAAGRAKEGSGWIQKAICSCPEEGNSPLQRCTMVCRSITLQLRADSTILSNPSSIALLGHAGGQLAKNLHGDPADLDELLVAVTSLRKSLICIILEDERKSKATDFRPCQEIIRKCLDLVALTVRFTVRYMGNDPSQTSNEKTLVRYMHRKKLVMAVAAPMVDSIGNIARVYAKSHVEDWMIIKGALDDCLDFVAHLKCTKDIIIQEPQSSTKLVALLPRLSTPCWYRYLDLKKNDTDSKEQKQCLRACIEILQACASEAQIAGSLILKLEHYGQLHESAKDDAGALNIYKEALGLFVSHGVLVKAAEAGSAKSAAYLFEEDSEARHLGRTLQAYTRVASRLRESGSQIPGYYDSAELHDDHRALLLGYQLSALTSKPRSRSGSNMSCGTIRDLSKVLLDLCSSSDYPTQRLYAVVQMLYLRINRSAAVEDTVLLPALDDYAETQLLLSYTRSGVHCYTSHLFHSLSLLMAIRKSPPDLKTVENGLRSWAEMLGRISDICHLQGLVYDIKAWYLQLELVIEFLGFQNLHTLKCLALYVYTSASEMSGSMEGSSVSLRLVQLGSQYVRLGYCGLGGKALRRVNNNLVKLEESGEARLSWHLASAEMALETDDPASCNDHLATVRALLKELSFKNDSRQSGFDRVQLYGMNADADLLQSKMAAIVGNSYEALLFARLSVKGYYRTWAILERQRADSAAKCDQVLENSQSDSLTKDLSELNITDSVATKAPSTKHAALENAAFWSLVPRMFDGLLVLCSGFAHAGLYSETMYYLGEAQKIAESVRAPALLAQFLAIKTFYTYQGGEAKEAEALLERAQDAIGKLPINQDASVLRLQMTKLGINSHPSESAMATLEDAKSILQDLKRRKHITLMFEKPDGVENVEEEFGDMSLHNHDSNSRAQRTRTAVPCHQSKAPKLIKEAQTLPTSSEDFVDVEVLALCRAEGEICRKQASAVLALGNLDMASALIQAGELKPKRLQDKISQALLCAEVSLRRGIQELASHPVYNIVPESTISYPSVCRSEETSRMFAVELKGQKQPRQPRKPSKRTVGTKKPESAVPEETDYQLLCSARQSIVGVLRLAQKIASSRSLYHLLDVFSRTMITLTALPTPSASAPFSPTSLIFATELGRIVSMLQGSLSARVEKHMLGSAQNFSADVTDVTSENDDARPTIDHLDVSTFEADYVNILPEAWDVVSMTLTESEEEVMISKLRLGDAPFMLRIPLNRQTGLDCEEASFGFAEARHELQDTVEMANRSSQDAQSQTQKIAKKEWWNTRNTLDKRIQNLLTNIESIWLGGFRGIFSQHRASTDTLARFQRSLQIILDKHLPSRQKSGKGSPVERVSLGSHVLELFVGLGTPSDSNDVDDQILDLIYFVVDILQFNGERNAYDEIDFDSIVVETIDALRQYHQAPGGPLEDQGRHTILILDKKLHCFPWESLPCMKGQPISRLPSLLCLRQRILQQRSRQIEKSDMKQADKGLRIRRQDGAFILNPAGDLANTQANFEDKLQGLSGWEGIADKEPQEADFKEYLQNHDLFLYFGHGSGSQYIRSRTVKRLDKCAVSLLMGCSSGALTEAGKFEPYGPPIDYMHAGCPALLANLWDVTDKDIDRFAQSVLEKWGLFEKEQQLVESLSPVKKSTRQKGKGKAREVPRVDQGERKTSMSLDEAVAQSRDACILKYLNGAAPVIYGIPVFLD